MRIAIVSAIDPTGLPQGDTLRLNGLIAGAQTFGEVDVMRLYRPTFSVDLDLLQQAYRYRSPYGALMSKFRLQRQSSIFYDVVIGHQLKSAISSLRISAKFYILDYTDSLGWYGKQLGWHWDSLAKRLMLTGVGATEIKVAEQFDETWISAVPDQMYLKKRGGAPIVVPNGVLHKERLVPGNPRHLLFVGNLEYFPNRTGLQWFIKTIWPMLLPLGYTMRVVGKGSEVFEGKGIRGLGRISDVRREYQQAGIIISPVSLGAGSQNKILEALGYGRPVVAVPAAIRGLSPEQRQVVQVAQWPHEWSAALGYWQDLRRYERYQTRAMETVFLWKDIVSARLRYLFG